MRLDTAYFTDNNKKIISYCSNAGYCSFAYLHCLCPINSARGTGPKKKKEEEEAKRKRSKRKPNGALMKN